jgi:hypothetical protein
MDCSTGGLLDLSACYMAGAALRVPGGVQGQLHVTIARFRARSSGTQTLSLHIVTHPLGVQLLIPPVYLPASQARTRNGWLGFRRWRLS